MNGDLLKLLLWQYCVSACPGPGGEPGVFQVCH